MWGVFSYGNFFVIPPASLPGETTNADPLRSYCSSVLRIGRKLACSEGCTSVKCGIGSPEERMGRRVRWYGGRSIAERS